MGEVKVYLHPRYGWLFVGMGDGRLRRMLDGQVLSPYVTDEIMAKVLRDSVEHVAVPT